MQPGTALTWRPGLARCHHEALCTPPTLMDLAVTLTRQPAAHLPLHQKLTHERGEELLRLPILFSQTAFHQVGRRSTKVIRVHLKKRLYFK